MKSNVLIDTDDRACVADFGLSIVLDEIGVDLRYVLYRETK